MMPGIWYIVGIYTTYEGVYLEVGGKFEYIKYLLRYSISELRVFALFLVVDFEMTYEIVSRMDISI